MVRTVIFLAVANALTGLPIFAPSLRADDRVVEQADRIAIETSTLRAEVRKSGYVSGIAAGSFVDKKTGAHDLGYGLDIVDWIMEPGSDVAYRDQLDKELVYEFGNPYHGARAKRSIEGPQICTRARELNPQVVRGKDFIAVKQSFRYHTSAPGKRIGSIWRQTIVFPQGKRYFLSCDRIEAVNQSDAMFLRIDLPGHIKHDQGDSFSEVYLSYLAETNRPDLVPGPTIPSQMFVENFAPDQQFNYRRQRLEEAGRPLPSRFIRAYRIRDPESGKEGPWLAGMTLDPSVVHEAWCHQRGYVCMIEEFGGRPVQPGGSFSAAFIVGYFDSIEEMHQVYDQYKGFTGLRVDADGWQGTR